MITDTDSDSEVEKCEENIKGKDTPLHVSSNLDASLLLHSCTRAVTFHLWGVNLVCAVCWCDHTTICEAYCFTTDGFGICNMRIHLGTCHTDEGGYVQTSERKILPPAGG